MHSFQYTILICFAIFGIIMCKPQETGKYSFKLLRVMWFICKKKKIPFFQLQKVLLMRKFVSCRWWLANAEPRCLAGIMIVNLEPAKHFCMVAVLAMKITLNQKTLVKYCASQMCRVLCMCSIDLEMSRNVY